jgi:TPR repeat protein
MKIPRRQFLHLAGLAAAVAVGFTLTHFLGGTFSYANETPKTTQCDLLAWSPHDPSSLDGGKEGGFWKMDAPTAIAACEAALAEQPGIARLQQRYAIALWKANRHDEAITWMRKAADQGFAPAQDDLGYLYREDPLVSGYSDKAELNAEAFRLQRLAAEQGNIIAMGDVGYCYMSGTGVGRDYGEALKWLRQPVEHDEPYAEAHLGEMYKNGWGVPQGRYGIGKVVSPLGRSGIPRRTI